MQQFISQTVMHIFTNMDYKSALLYIFVCAYHFFTKIVVGVLDGG